MTQWRTQRGRAAAVAKELILRPEIRDHGTVGDIGLQRCWRHRHRSKSSPSSVSKTKVFSCMISELHFKSLSVRFVPMKIQGTWHLNYYSFLYVPMIWDTIQMSFGSHKLIPKEGSLLTTSPNSPSFEKCFLWFTLSPTPRIQSLGNSQTMGSTHWLRPTTCYFWDIRFSGAFLDLETLGLPQVQDFCLVDSPKPCVDGG